MKNCRVTPVVTGDSWLGKGTRAIETVLEEMIDASRLNLLILAYRLSDGASPLLNRVEARLRAGVQVTMVVNSMITHHGESSQRLLTMARQWPDHFHLYEFCGSKGEELHAKLIVADDTTALVGSANLSWSGFLLNHEFAVKIEGAAAEAVAIAARRILNAPQVHRRGSEC